MKPPLGLMPKTINDEIRFNAVKEVIQRYMNKNCEIKLEWVKEYNETVKKFGCPDKPKIKNTIKSKIVNLS